MIPARLSVVTLATADVPRLRAFYESLGWPLAGERRSDHAFLGTRGAALALWDAGEAGEEIGRPLGRHGHAFRGVTLAMNVDRPEEVDAALGAARAAGAQVVAEATDRSWGGRSGYLADPEGTPWEVAWVPGGVPTAG